MSGFCGTLGAIQPGPDRMLDPLRWTGAEERRDFRWEDVSVRSAVLPEETSGAYAKPAGGTNHWWVSGDIDGFRVDGEYIPADGPPAALLAALVDEHGLEVLGDINGTFAAVWYDASADELTVITDRLGSRPIYYAVAADGLVFGTHVQSVLAHPAIETQVAPDGLMEYCTLGRVTGVATPFVGVKAMPPSSWVTVDHHGNPLERDRYWEPARRPIHRSFAAVRDRYASLLEEAFAQHLREDRRYGLLLSGGSDSRLLLDLMLDHLDPDNIIAYHLADWLSEEARTAEQVALAADVDFQLLRRGPGYHRETLERVAPLMNFYGRFEQAHTALMTDRLRSEVDELITGLYADTWFRALPLPRYQLPVGRVGQIELPIAKRSPTPRKYLQRYPDRSPAYLRGDRSIRDVLADHLTERPDGSIIDHGISYPSLASLSLYVDVYPLWNDPDSFYFTLTQTMPHWTPFLDDRLVDLARTVPLPYQLRRNLSNAVLRERGSPLAEIPHASTGVPPKRGFPAHFAGTQLTSLRQDLFADGPPRPEYAHHPWRPITAVLEYDRFPGEVLAAEQDTIENVAALDWDGVLEEFRVHLEEESRGRELYTLLSFLRSSVLDDADRLRVAEGGERR